MRTHTLLLVLILAVSSMAYGQKDVWMGGNVGFSVPSNIGRSGDQIGFRDVAKSGFQMAFTGRWFYNKRLSLGWDVGGQFQDGNKDFWDVNNFGTVTSNYSALHLLVEGNYYFSHQEIKPYCGVSFGAYILFNTMTFDSAYTGTDADASVSYKANQWKPGFKPQAGLLIDLSKRAMFDIKTGFVLIPNLEETVSTVIENGWPKTIIQNPHGHQHQWVISIGLLFLI
ncbi:MAG: hypothetical protein JEZ14_13365 [Marinilabiliaceae bacterium]|nr:hypothetical protein [Marinilabiliaceae bacterium]